jgi:uncharacterized repeat protein (TIGR03803 family)
MLVDCTRFTSASRWSRASLPSVAILILTMLIAVTSSAPARAGETRLYSFAGGSGDGKYPFAGLVADQNGALYGTANEGGIVGANCASGCGVVFKLTPPSAGETQWTESLLYSFCSQSNCADGALPWGALIFDWDGALYGTTGSGGSVGHGTVFKLTPPGGGETNWTETTLYSFCSLSSCTDGIEPESSLIFDSAGALYGTTTGGGSVDYGTVFKVTPPAGGQAPWTGSVLHSFAGSDGRGPGAGLIVGEGGALYSTTADGGSSNDGTVFRQCSVEDREMFLGKPDVRCLHW